VIAFKEAENNYNTNDLVRYYSTLSNEANLINVECECLVFGVTNKHQIVGSMYRTDSKNLYKLKQEIAAKTTNQITFMEIYELQVPHGRVVMF